MCCVEDEGEGKVKGDGWVMAQEGELCSGRWRVVVMVGNGV